VATKANWWTAHPQDALVVIREALRANPTLIDHNPKYLEALQTILYKYRHFLGGSTVQNDVAVNVAKEGGIIKAQKGVTLDPFGNVIEP
jgi:hypothetical protein